MLYGGTAALAGLAGAGVAWWKFQPHAVDEKVVAPTTGSVAGSATDAFWSLNFDTPDGKNLSMSSFRGKLLLVNFWATWCPPCVEELPLLDYFYQENRDKNLQVLGLAVDQPSAVRTWLQTRPLHFAVGMAGLSLHQDTTRYFAWHHSANDTLDKVDLEQLRQNVAAYAVAMYLAAEADRDFGSKPGAFVKKDTKD
jgi:thiol-disulfide isomerase/thioredoxin